MKHRRTAFIEDNLWEGLDKLKLRTGTSISFNISKGIEKILKENKVKMI